MELELRMVRGARGRGEYAWVESPGHRQHTQLRQVPVDQVVGRDTCICKINKEIV